MAAKRFWQFWDWGWRINDIATVIKSLVLFFLALGGSMTFSLWSEVPWQFAIVAGAMLSASLIIAVAGIDYLIRIHSISKKIAVVELGVVHITTDKAGKLLMILMAHVANHSIRPIWYKIEKVHCHIDKTTHDPSPHFEALEVQPATTGGVPIPPITGLDPSKQQLHGRLEIELSYGKKEAKLRKKYKTNGQFTVYVFPSAIGLPLASIIATGAKADYS